MRCDCPHFMTIWFKRIRIYAVHVLAGVAVTSGLNWNTCPLQAASFTHIVAFGDSLTDTGNIFDVTSNPINAALLAFLLPSLDTPFPPPPYFDGRFSNGPVWVERMANQLGLGPLTPSERGGFNYAVGGATTFDDGNFFINLILPDDVEDQVDAYLNHHTPSGNELFVVEGGANDLLSAGVTDVTIPTGNLAGFISDLHDAGGRNFLVPNLPSLGKIPRKVGGADEVVLDMRTADFNAELDERLDILEQTLANITIYRVDFFGEVQLVLADPFAFEFTNATNPAFNPDANQVVPNPHQYLFWDDIHPTAPAHLLLGDLAADAFLPPDDCDFNLDDSCNVNDLHVMFQQGNLVTGVPIAADNLFDLNDDLSIDQTDIDLWLNEAALVNGYDSPFRRGDVDDVGNKFPAERDVDITDFDALAVNFDPTGANAASNTWTQGNFDSDDDVDITDFNVLAANYAPTGYGAGIAVPEPSSLTLCMMGLIIAMGIVYGRSATWRYSGSLSHPSSC